MMACLDGEPARLFGEDRGEQRKLHASPALDTVPRTSAEPLTWQREEQPRRREPEQNWHEEAERRRGDAVPTITHASETE